MGSKTFFILALFMISFVSCGPKGESTCTMGDTTITVVDSNDVVTDTIPLDTSVSE